MSLDIRYNALTAAQMKPATAKALSKFWTNKLKALKLAMQVDGDGKHSSIDTLGEDFIIENFIWPGAFDDDTMQVTLGDLLESREREQELVQFEIGPTNVEKLITSTEYGLVKGFPLMKLPEIVFLPKSDQWIIGGGRNRAVAIATIMKQTYGAEDMNIPVTVYRAETLQEVVEYIKLSNTSRTMTQTEKTQLKLAAQGTQLQVFSDADDIFKQGKNSKTLTALKDLSRMAFASILSDTIVGEDTTINTLGDIGAAFFTKLSKGLNAHAKKSADALLVVLEKGQVFELVVKQATDALKTNWSAYKQEISRDTGKVTKDGLPVIECNISRNAGAIGQMLSELILTDVGDKLKIIAEQSQAKTEAAKQGKKAESEATKLQKELQALDASLDTFKRIGAPVPAEMLVRINESKAGIQAQIDALNAQAATAAPAPSAAPAAPGQPVSPAAEQAGYSSTVASLLS